MNKFKTQSLVSTWLIPAAQDRKLLSVAMNELNNRYNAPKFIPHITLYSTHFPKGKVDQAKSFIAHRAKYLKPLTLTVSTIKHSDFLFKALFAEFEKNPALFKLHETLKKEFGKFGDYNFNPHLSLLYKILGPKKNERIIKRLQIPRIITFDTLGVTVHKDEYELINIPGWEITTYEKKKK